MPKQSSNKKKQRPLSHEEALEHAYQNVQESNSRLGTAVEKILKKMEDEQKDMTNAVGTTNESAKCLEAEAELKAYLGNLALDLKTTISEVENYRRDAAEPVLQSYRESLKQLMT